MFGLLKTSDENILIDTSPDLRQQLLRHKSEKLIKFFFLTCMLTKHGINDLRSFLLK